MKKNEFISTKSHYNTIQFQSGSGIVMDVGGGVHDDAVDVTYSTRPDTNNFGDSRLKVGVGSGIIMGVGGGIHDEAVDVTYSTMPDTNNYTGSGLTVGEEVVTSTASSLMPSYSTSDINKFRGSSLLLGVGRGVHDNAVDITYSDKNDEKDEKIKDLEININLLNKQILEQKNKIFVLT